MDDKDAVDELKGRLGEQGFVFSSHDFQESLETLSFYRELKSFPENGDQMDALVHDTQKKVEAVLEKIASALKMRIKESYAFKLKEWKPCIELIVAMPIPDTKQGV